MEGVRVEKISGGDNEAGIGDGEGRSTEGPTPS